MKSHYTFPDLFSDHKDLRKELKISLTPLDLHVKHITLLWHMS